MDKRCKRCGEVKPLDAFYRHDGCRDGVRPECKECNLAEKARRHAADPEPARERTRRWQEENPERYRADHDDREAIRRHLWQHDPHFEADRERIRARVAALKRPA